MTDTSGLPVTRPGPRARLGGDSSRTLGPKDCCRRAKGPTQDLRRTSRGFCPSRHLTTHMAVFYFRGRALRDTRYFVDGVPPHGRRTRRGADGWNSPLTVPRTPCCFGRRGHRVREHRLLLTPRPSRLVVPGPRAGPIPYAPRSVGEDRGSVEFGLSRSGSWNSQLLPSPARRRRVRHPSSRSGPAEGRDTGTPGSTNLRAVSGSVGGHVDGKRHGDGGVRAFSRTRGTVLARPRVPGTVKFINCSGPSVPFSSVDSG